MATEFPSLEEELAYLYARDELCTDLLSQRDALLEACKAARHVWSQGNVDRGYKDERNWIDEALDKIDDAIAKAEGTDGN